MGVKVPDVDQIKMLDAGPTIDALVHELIFGKKVGLMDMVPKYSSDIRQAWRVLVRFIVTQKHSFVMWGPHPRHGGIVFEVDKGKAGSLTHTKPALIICRTCLVAVIKDDRTDGIAVKEFDGVQFGLPKVTVKKK